VEITASRKPDWLWILVKGGVGVFEVLAILANLHRRMKHVALSSSNPARYDLIRLGRLATLPLFQLDDDGLVTGAVIATADHTVDAFRTKRQLVFE
jgi:N6-adenosine-specific RNA methylase IME4